MELLPWVEFAWTCWRRLHPSRPREPIPQVVNDQLVWITTPRQIPWRDIDAYARRHRLTGDLWDLLEALIPALDDEYLTYEEKRRKC